MSLYDYAERELDLMGLTDDGDMNGMMRKHVLHIVNEFAKEGHTGFSANYAISILKRLLAFEPLTPLTGEDWEWTDVSDQAEKPMWQNARCSRVFKDEDGAYDIEGRVFWTWMTDKETGEKFKSFYTSKDSRVYITFPYTPDTVYEEVTEDEQ